MIIRTLFIVILLYTHFSIGAEYIRIAGSSSAFPFVSAIAEDFAQERSARFIVETIGSGSGIKFFCSGFGGDYPDLAMSSRPMRASEREFCRKNGVEEVREIALGMDALVLAHSKEASAMKLSAKQIYLALAKFVPGDILNNYYSWQEINPTLPNMAIYVYGPSPSSGSYDVLMEKIIQPNCPYNCRYKCEVLREDGAYVEIGKNENLVLQKLIKDPTSIGVISYNIFKHNENILASIPINGVKVSRKTITDGQYILGRKLYLYSKKNSNKDKQFIEFITSKEGIKLLSKKGLIELAR